jgi:hypothetical protein
MGKLTDSKYTTSEWLAGIATHACVCRTITNVRLARADTVCRIQRSAKRELVGCEGTPTTWARRHALLPAVCVRRSPNCTERYNAGIGPRIPHYRWVHCNTHSFITAASPLVIEYLLACLHTRVLAWAHVGVSWPCIMRSPSGTSVS